MITLSLLEAAQIVQAQYAGKDAIFSGCSIDSREIKAGHLFVAIKGERFDGHDFVLAAKEAGAVAALVEQAVAVDFPQLIVGSTIEALGALAANWRARHDVKLVGVTGSNGKTTTKDMLASIFKKYVGDEKVLAPKKSFNNHLGVPLTLLSLSSDHEFGVIEMGMNHFGEIAYLTKITKPQVAMITNAAESHLKGVGSVAGVAKAKGEIFQGLPNDGVAILNKADPYYAYWRGLLSETQSVRDFALTQDAMVYSKCYNREPFKEGVPTQDFDCVTPEGEIAVSLPLLGAHNVLNALAASAAAAAFNVPLTAIKAGLEHAVLSPGRLQVQTTQTGYLLLNDTYNANPFSLAAALTVLKDFSGAGKKVLVLGDMGELGDEAVVFHKEAGERAKASGLDALWCLGELTAHTAQAFGEGAHYFNQLEPLLQALKNSLHKEDCVLVKGSRSMKMEKVVEALLEE